MGRRPDRRALAGAAIALAIAVFAWLAWFPSDERQIRRQLTGVADRLNEPSPGVAAVAQAAAIGAAFADDVVVDFGEGAPVRGRETLMGIVAPLQPRTRRYEVKIRDMNVHVVDARSASVDLSATTTSDNGMDAREFQVAMVKRDGRWLIARVTPVKVLEK